MNSIFNATSNKIPLIIVYDKETVGYATFLQQLISQKNDVEVETAKTAGEQKNYIDATIWTTKVYEDNLSKLTSNTHVIFIGSSKTAKDHGRNIHFSYEKYGMHYGWLGKRAVLYVDTKKKFKKKEYEAFFALCNEYSKKLEKTNVSFANMLSSTKNRLHFLYVFDFSVIFSTRAFMAEVKRINDQQYRCLTLVFYMEGLQKFLEE